MRFFLFKKFTTFVRALFTNNKGVDAYFQFPGFQFLLYMDPVNQHLLGGREKGYIWNKLFNFTMDSGLF